MHLLSLPQSNNTTYYQEKIENLLAFEPWANWDVGLVSEDEIITIASKSFSFLKKENNLPLNLSLLKLANRIESEEYISYRLKKLGSKIKRKINLFTHNKFPGSKYEFFMVDSNQLSLQVFVKNEGTRLLDLEQVASLLEAANHPAQFDCKRIDSKSAEFIRNIFSDVMPELKTTEPPSLIDLKKEYDVLYFKILSHILKARKTGKKVLILIGESHNSKKSLLGEFMIIDIASKFGIKNLILELDSECLDLEKNVPLDPVDSGNFSFHIKLARESDYTIILGDPKHHLGADDPKRNKAINQTIHEVNEDAISINGAFHMFHICKDKAINERYEILAINSAILKPIRQISELFKDERQEFDFITDNKNVIQLSISGNPYKYNFFTTSELKEITKKIGIKNENAIKVEQKLGYILDTEEDI